MSQKARIPEVDTALHMVKGAIVKVLHTPLTVSTECHKKHEGRIAVQYKEKVPPPAETLKKIEQLANQLRNDNVEITETVMDRAEAEAKYQKNPVNETFIYDKFPVPATVKELRVLEIKDWNVNCCSGVHLKRTGDVRPIKIDRINHRPQKEELEFVFLLNENEGSTSGNAKEAASKKGKGAAKASQKPPSAPVKQYDDVHFAASDLITDILANLAKQGIDLKGQEGTLSTQLLPQVEHKLTLVKNAAYARGFHSNPSHSTQLTPPTITLS